MKKFLLTAILSLIATYVFAQESIAVFPFEDIDNVLTRNESFMLYDEFNNEFANRGAGTQRMALYYLIARPCLQITPNFLRLGLTTWLKWSGGVFPR